MSSKTTQIMATAAKPTEATRVAARLRDEIVRGVVRPGTKLKLVPLAQRYEVGRGPLREAACRLASEGLVVIEEQRGFRVAPISRRDLIDVTRTRQRIEGLAVRDAIAHGQLEWEGEILSALHVLARGSATAASAAGRESFARRHRAFHAALCAACPSTYLLQFRAMLYAHTERYRCLAADAYRERRDRGREVFAEHEALAEAVVARDAERACALLDEHLQRTADTLLASYPELFEEA